MKSTYPITYFYDFEGHEIAIPRRHVGTAYARNGNVGNPTEYFVWDAKVDGKLDELGCFSRANAYEHARAHILGITYRESDPKNYRPGPKYNVNVRPYAVVRDEMKTNSKRARREKRGD